MKRIALSLLVIMSVVSLAHTADAASPIQITKIYFDSPGSDTRSNASLNGEYVTLKNTTSKARSLKGYTVRDASNHVYTFSTYTLKAGGSVKVHTGKGTNTATDRYWSSAAYIWNNTGDKATLKNSTGSVQDTCSYKSGTYVNC